MADLNISLNVADNGSIKKRTTDATELNTVLSKTEKILARMNAPKSSYRASMGPAGEPGEEFAGYRQARAASGTGAASRDFAKQAQGLGGLVRVYATFAANLFAVGAAFRALREAADTSNMIEGLNQLGAQSGRSLGNLSKQLVEATDGAISLKEAMTATAQATAAGMTSANLLKIGVGAKQISQALGVSVPDAVSRLSRGITKLEPELLDELGIFVKIETASQNYARTLGKTAASLTDFEKRQGFANEVIAQMEEKFGKIKLASNSYDKLIASIKDLTFKGLELVNTVLGPIVDLLSRSPTALGVTLAGIAAVLIRQAIPAIGQYRLALQKASEEALLAVSGRSQAAAKALALKKAQATVEAETIAQTFVDARDKATDRFTEASKGKFAASKKRVSAIVEKGIYEITPEDIAYLNKQAEKNKGRNEELANSYRDLANVIQGGQQAEQNYQRVRSEAAQAQLDLDKKSRDTLKEDVEFRKRSQAAVISGISATTYAQAQQLGVLKSVAAGWKQVISARKGAELEIAVPGQFLKDPSDPTGKKFLTDEYGNKLQATSKVAVEGLGNMATAAGLARVAVSGVASGLASVISKLGTVGIALGIVAGVFEVFDLMLSNSRKEAEEYAKSSKVLTGALDNVGRTLDAIANKNPDKILSAESIQARANAFNEMQQSLAEMVKRFDELGKKQNWWDRSVEGTQRFLSRITGGYSERLFGGGARKELAEGLSKSIINSIRLAEAGPARDKISQELSKLVGFDVGTLNQEGLTEALNALDFDTLSAKANKLSKEIARFSNESNNAASAITAVQEALKLTEKEVDTLIASLALTDSFGKIGTNLISLSNKMTTALKDPANAIVALKDVASSAQTLSILPPDLASRLIGAREGIVGITTKLGVAREEARKAREELARLRQAGEATGTQQAKVRQAELNVSQLEADARTQVSKFSADISQALFSSGVAYLEKSLKDAMREGGILAAKGYLSALSSLGGNVVESETKLRLEELNIQKSLIDAQYAAREAQERNSIALEKNTLVKELELETAKLKEAKSPEQSKESLDKLAAISRNILINEEKSKILQKPTLANIRGIQARGLQGPEDLGLDKEAAAQMSQFVTTLYAKQAQLAKIGGQEAAVIAENIVKSNRAQAVEKNKILDLSIKDQQIALSSITARQSILGTYSEELADSKKTADLEIIRLNAEKERNTLIGDINAAMQLEGKFGKDSTEEKQRQLVLVNLRKQVEQNLTKEVADRNNVELATLNEKLLKQEEYDKKVRDLKMQEANIDTEIANARLSVEETVLNAKKALGLVNEEEEANEKARIDLAKQKLEYETKVLAISQAEAALLAEKVRLEELRKSGAGSVEAERLNQLAIDNIAKQKKALDEVNDAKIFAINSTKDLSSSFAQMQKVIAGTFDKLADALTEFVKTGKFSFKSLIDSMLLDLIRLNLRKTTQGLYASLGLDIGGGRPSSGSAASGGNNTSSNSSGGQSTDAAKGIVGGALAILGIKTGIDAFAQKYNTNPGSQQTKMLYEQSGDMEADTFDKIGKNISNAFSSKQGGIISSIIEGITGLFKGIFGAAGSLLSLLFGSSGKSVANVMPGLGTINPNSGEFMGSLEFAKGGAFNAGIQKFAQGGAFTNSIVNSPTIFKFAKGTGMMGEAGPEAIMPLKRDSKGNLGVSAGSSPTTSVVVNNYGSETATTRETTDSSGNRKIEVIIGEVVAQQVSRTGSATQNAMSNTFYTKPAVVRR